jgi:hypothetical protein
LIVSAVISPGCGIFATRPSGLFALARCKAEAPCRILAVSFLLVACDLPSQIIEKLCGHLKLIQVFFQIQDFSSSKRVHRASFSKQF